MAQLRPKPVSSEKVNCSRRSSGRPGGLCSGTPRTLTMVVRSIPQPWRKDMAPTTPEWLSRRGGELRPGVDSNTWQVFFDGEPQYRLTPIPVQGKHGCQIVQTINGRRLDAPTTFNSR